MSKEKFTQPVHKAPDAESGALDGDSQLAKHLETWKTARRRDSNEYSVEVETGDDTDSANILEEVTVLEDTTEASPLMQEVLALGEAKDLTSSEVRELQAIEARLEQEGSELERRKFNTWLERFIETRRPEVISQDHVMREASELLDEIRQQASSEMDAVSTMEAVFGQLEATVRNEKPAAEAELQEFALWQGGILLQLAILHSLHDTFAEKKTSTETETVLSSSEASSQGDLHESWDPEAVLERYQSKEAKDTYGFNSIAEQKAEALMENYQPSGIPLNYDPAVSRTPTSSAAEKVTFYDKIGDKKFFNSRVIREDDARHEAALKRKKKPGFFERIFRIN